MINNIFKSPDSASGKNDNWRVDCQLFAKNDSFFKFRSHPTILHIVEGSPIRAGVWILRRLKRNPNFYSFIDKFLTSDTVGSPKNLINFKLKKRNIRMNPTTLRYVNNILNLVDLFGNDIFIFKSSDNKVRTIVEIGAGYGGECKIANDFLVGHNNIEIGQNWKIFDLESSLPLISRWLNKFEYNASLNSNPDFLDNISLVISNAAFSEMSRDLQEEYFKKMIIPAQRGYFIENFGIFSSPFGGFTREEFINRLKNAGKHVVELDASTWLSNFDKYAKSGLIVFSEKEIIIPARKLYIIDKIEILFRQILLSVPFLPRFQFFKHYLDKRG